MGLTAIKQVVNCSRFTVTLWNSENSDKFMNGGAVGPHASLAVDMWIPWATTLSEFRKHHIRVSMTEDERPVRTFDIHQRAWVDGDFVRVGEIDASDDAALGYGSAPIGGVAETGGDRCLMVDEGGGISLQRV